MHFDSALFVFVVSFLTSAWSDGLNSEQLQLLSKEFENYKTTKNAISEGQIAQLVKSFGLDYSNKIHFAGYLTDNYDSYNLLNLLLPLAKYNDSPDGIKDDSLTFDEICFFEKEYLRLMRLFKQAGYLTLRQLSGVFINWRTMNDSFEKKINELKTIKGDDYVMNAADILLIIVGIKPVGCGLTLKQVKQFGSLYVENTSGSSSIDLIACKTMFDEFGIPTTEDELELLLSEPDLTTGRLLMDIIEAAAERNTTAVDDDGLNLLEVVRAVNKFVKMDHDKDGLLSPNEYAEYLEKEKKDLNWTRKYNAQVKRGLLKANGTNSINIADYIVVEYFAYTVASAQAELIDNFTNKFRIQLEEFIDEYNKINE